MADGMGGQVEHHGCDDGDRDWPCAICRGEVPDAFAAMIAHAAGQPGRVMTADEFSAWLDSL